MIERSRRVVLLIDYDNLQICASRDTPGRDLQLAPVVQLAQHYGTVILARAYAEWNLSTERLAVYKAGIEPAFAPVLRTEGDRAGKSLADTVMVAEGMDMLWTLSPEVVVLATSDKDLIPLVRVAKQRGAFVVVLGSDFTAIPLREMADEHVTYRQLITDGSGRFTAEAGPTPRQQQQQQQPATLPESPRRRPRERVGRERVAVTPATVVPPAALAPPAAAAVPPTTRIEREPAPTTRIEREPASTAFAAEAVAPLTGGLSGDADSQGLGRRRRRRGSRRRSERGGLTGEGQAGYEPGSEAEVEEADDLALPYEAEESTAPYRSDESTLPFQSDGSTLRYEPDEDDAVVNGVDEASAGLFVAPDLDPRVEGNNASTELSAESLADTLAELEVAGVEGVVPPPPSIAPAPRDRRRRSRRPAAEVTGATLAVQDPLQLPTSSLSAGLVPDPEDPVVAAAQQTVITSVEPGPASSTPVGEALDSDQPAAEGAAPVRRRRRTTGPTAGRARPAGG